MNHAAAAEERGANAPMACPPKTLLRPGFFSATPNLSTVLRFRSASTPLGHLHTRLRAGEGGNGDHEVRRGRKRTCAPAR